MNFEMANGDDPEEIILATQRSLIRAIKEILVDLRKETDMPGLTWEQLDYFLTKFGDKKPTVITQKDII